jgi:hypothetical protein
MSLTRAQYPHERETCFPPVLGLEVMTHPDGSPVKRTEAAVVVISLRPSTARAGGVGFGTAGADLSELAVPPRPMSCAEAVSQCPATTWALLLAPCLRVGPPALSRRSQQRMIRLKTEDERRSDGKTPTATRVVSDVV